MSQVKRRELFPGVWLRAVHTNKFKSAYLSVTLMSPLDPETAGANALIPSVLRRGTAVHPDMESLSAALDGLYGGAIEPAVRKKGETQCVGFAASFLDDAYALEGEQILEPAAALLGEVLLKPYTQDGVFSPDYTAGEKANLLDRIRGQINDKRTYATHRLTQLMCGEEAFGVDKLGDEAHVEAITPASLWQRYQQLLREAAVEVYYCGSAQPDRVEAAMRSALAGLPVNGDRLDPDCEVRISAGPEPRVVEEAMDVTQGKLAMGFRTGGLTCWEEDYPALVLCNAIFGGTTLSKLFLNVREKLSLCYYASSVLEKMKGLVLVSSGIEFDKYQQARDEILAQLDNIRSGKIEDWELEGARRTVISGNLATLDDQARQEEFWLGQAAAGLDETAEELAARFEAVTREQVMEAARKLELDTIYFLKGKED
ncbi:EF-P 5-aminopentanol modification-associated protein YfmF [Pseudoflavonifractor phocaeensis]|uniref:EF-P 5-aminopentanol modification-associated protein YfmF n=1 Tax=Pseudoflavonifractor phocaeensis TaxID=1870988 RepID=UPI0022868906|nr:pitrilysin family protein [Pseudoflavonifractor phocaeensis]MCF2595923.1 insulinase family protein [Pseudoflavonifractor phocaeensis]